MFRREACRGNDQVEVAILLSSKQSALVIIDLQPKLAAVIPSTPQVVHKTRILLEAARRLDVPVVVTEQYPKGLGHTLEEVAEKLPNDASVCPKIAFSAARDAGFIKRIERLEQAGRDQVVICGAETHICVLQTALELKRRGDAVYLVTDASGARVEANARAAVERALALGVQCVTTEMVLFEWLEAADTEAFGPIQALIR